MAYVLESMLRIREMREDRAGKELVAARHARDTAVAERTACRERVQQYAQTKEERRDSVFATILNRPVPRSEIDLVNQAIASIDEEGVLLNDALHRAEAAVEERNAEAEKAHGRYVVSVKEHAKVTQHKAIWEEAERREQEQRADAEMEEFTGRRLTDDDADDLD